MDKFKVAFVAVLEHHFNNHDSCGDWCKAVLGTEEEMRQTGLRFRCKVHNKELYLFLKKHDDKFMVDAKLRQLYHQYDTNNVEGCNNIFAEGQHLLSDDWKQTRSLLAVGLQSIGYRKFYNHVFALTGINLRDHDFFRSEDAEKLRKKLHRRKERECEDHKNERILPKAEEGSHKIEGRQCERVGIRDGHDGARWARRSRKWRPTTKEARSEETV
jgi:hypothetical protein